MRTLAFLAVVLAACGGSGGGSGGGGDGDPITSGTIQGTYEGVNFTPKFGFATLYENQSLIGLGEDDTLECGSEDMEDPPSGAGIIISGFAYTTAGPQTSIQVSLYKSSPTGFHSTGSTGDVTLTQVDESTIAGSVDFDYTDDEQKVFGAHGDFVVIHCAE